MSESQFKFRTPILTSFSFICNPKYKSVAGIPVPMELAFERNVNRQKNENQAIVELTLHINKKTIKTPDDTEVPYTMTVQYVGHFTWDVSVDENMVERFLQTNAPALLLSYYQVE